MTKILFVFFDSALILTISKKISYFVIQSSVLGMSSISNSEEQPPESPLDFLSRVATMVEKVRRLPLLQLYYMQQSLKIHLRQQASRMLLQIEQHIPTN